MSDSEAPDLAIMGMRGGAAVVLGQLSRTLVQFVGLLLLARLLAPAEFGLVAMVTAITGVTAVFSDFGLSMSLIRSVEIDRRVRDSLWFFNAALALVVAAVVFALAPAVAHFYGDPRLLAVTQWLSLAALINGLVPQYRAELARTHRFRALGNSDWISQSIGVGSGLLGAAFGLGYWSIVLQQIVSACLLLAVMVLFSGYVPTSPPRLSGLSTHLKMGGSTLAVQATNYAAVNLPSIVLGRVAGAAAVGLFSRAYQLVALPMVQLAAPLTRVVVPMFALVRSTEGLQSAARKVHLLVSNVLLLVLSLIFVGGTPLVVVLFGEAWASAGWPVIILATGGLFQAVGYINYWLFVQRGRLGLLWILESISWAVAAPLYFLLSEGGATGVAATYATGLLVNWLLVSLVGLPRLDLQPRDFLVPSLCRLLWFCPPLFMGTIARELAIGAGWPSGAVLAISIVAHCLALAASFTVNAQFRNEWRLVVSTVRPLLPNSAKA